MCEITRPITLPSMGMLTATNRDSCGPAETRALCRDGEEGCRARWPLLPALWLPLPGQIQTAEFEQQRDDHIHDHLEAVAQQARPRARDVRSVIRSP